ncbi:FAD/NAD(P)-binding oxidoreductase family protein isoform X2 [Wolffia australiana]
MTSGSFQLFRKLDGLAEDIERLQPPLDHWRKFIYCTSLSGTVLGSVDHIKPQDFERTTSPTFVAHLSQYKLTRLLLKKLENNGFCVTENEELSRNEGSGGLEKRILMGQECVSVRSLPAGVEVGMLSRDGGFGKEMQRKIHCEILVGADGARSSVRRLVGIKMEGERDLQKLVSVHFLSRDLGRYLLEERPGMLFFIFNSNGIGVLVAHDLSQGEFVLQVPFYPPQQGLEDFSPRVCEGIIDKLVGWKVEDVEIVDIKPWVMHAEVAKRFSACNGRVVIAGDAAHRFPPAGGFGMNTGIQDAHNLAWKIAAFLGGLSPLSILETYETERRPIALFNTKLSVQNFRAAMSIPAALGLDPAIANTVHSALNSGVGSLLPSAMQKTILEGIFAIGRVQVSDFLLKGKNPLVSSRLAKLRSILDEGKSLQLQFPAEDIGFRYKEGALANDGDLEKTLENREEHRRDYVPSSEPGSRMPHMPLRLLNCSKGDIISTLDLIPVDKLEFVLIIAPVKGSYILAETARTVAQEFGAILSVSVIWPPGCFFDMSKPRDGYLDLEQVMPSLSWWETCGISQDGAIMVRPDDHVAWRTTCALGDDAADQIRRAFSKILGITRF